MLLCSISGLLHRQSLSPFCGAALELKPPLGLGKAWLGSNLLKGREAKTQSRGGKNSDHSAEESGHRDTVKGSSASGTLRVTGSNA